MVSTDMKNWPSQVRAMLVIQSIGSTGRNMIVRASHGSDGEVLGITA